MRNHSRRLLIGWLSVCALAPAAAAQRPAAPHAGAIEVRILPVPPLTVGSHATLEIEVRLPPDAARALLLTPSVEGPAIEVVRGRLARADARDSDANPLRFQLPIRVRSVGTSVLRVQARGHACPDRCFAIGGSAHRALEVSAAP